jgi:hypothetical protein
MQCLSCSEEVSPKFLHCIAKNNCPFCGGLIMPEELQTSLNELRGVMTTIGEKSFLKEAQDWLRSNCDLVAVDSDEYRKREDDFSVLEASFTELSQTLLQVKNELDEIKKRPQASMIRDMSAIKMGVDADGKPIQLAGEQLQDQSQTNVFMQRAGITKNLKDSSGLRRLANKLKTTDDGTNVLAAAFNAPGDDYDQYANQYEEEEDMEPLDHIAEQFASMGAGGYVPPTAHNPKTLGHQKAAGAAKSLARTGNAGLISRAG